MTVRDVLNVLPDENPVVIGIVTNEGKIVQICDCCDIIKLGLNKAILGAQVLKMQSVPEEVIKLGEHVWEGFLYILIRMDSDNSAKKDA